MRSHGRARDRAIRLLGTQGKFEMSRFEMHKGRCALYLAASFALLAAPVRAQDNDGWYAGGAVGFGRPVAIGDNKSGIIPALSAGYSFDNGLRPEAELSYRYNSKDGGAEHAASLMGNLWYDFWHNGYYFYAGGGFGATRVNLSGDGISGVSDTSPAWQIGSGFGHSITSNLTLGLDFRHLASLNTLKYNINGQSVETSHYMTSAAMLELRYSFGHGYSHAVTATEPPTRVVPVER
jgi:hypothetical protein